MRSLPGVANGGMEAAHMRKFLIGSLLRELATILGAIIASGLTWSFCTGGGTGVSLLPKSIALVVALAVAGTYGIAMYGSESR